jgi:hypothetical protein
MKQYNGGNWARLIVGYKHVVMLVRNIVQNNDRSPEEKEEAHVPKAADFLFRFQCSQARNHLQSNGLGNHTDPAIADQMTRKHPACKAPMNTLSNDEMQLPRRGIDHDVFLPGNQDAERGRGTWTRLPPQQTFPCSSCQLIPSDDAERSCSN